MLPRFLVIGAMKAGTTTLYEDLRSNSAIFLPEKERALLLQADITTASGRERYGRLFRGASPEQVPGDVSSPYAKLPESDGVVERSETVLGRGFRVIYLVRDPIDRVVSHHHHEASRGRMPSSIDDAVLEMPALINYSKYSLQLRPWTELLGPDHVRVIQFEEYVRDRVGVLDSLYRFLEVPPERSFSHLHKAHNVSAGHRVATGQMGRLAKSAAYRRAIRPLLPSSARRIGGQILLPKAPARPRPPTSDTVDRIIQAISPELPGLAALCDSPPRLWDLQATRKRYLELAQQFSA